MIIFCHLSLFRSCTCNLWAPLPPVQMNRTVHSQFWAAPSCVWQSLVSYIKPLWDHPKTRRSLGHSSGHSSSCLCQPLKKGSTMEMYLVNGPHYVLSPHTCQWIIQNNATSQKNSRDHSSNLSVWANQDYIVNVFSLALFSSLGIQKILTTSAGEIFPDAS